MAFFICCMAATSTRSPRLPLQVLYMGCLGRTAQIVRICGLRFFMLPAGHSLCGLGHL